MGETFNNLLLIEIVDDHTNKQVQAEEWSAYDEYNEIYITPHGCLVLRLAIFTPNINCIVHDFKPPHECRHLEQCQVAIPDIVKVDIGHFPVDNAGSIKNWI